MALTPYLDFDGRCDEAIAFYRTALGAEVTMLMRFKDNPEPSPDMTPPGADEKVMHAALRIGEAVLMASDMRCGGSPDFKGVSLSLDVADAAEAKARFDALADGGTVVMPIERTFWSAAFGMVADRFGVTWMVVAPPAG